MSGRLATKVCSIPDCGKTVTARGYCWSHSNRIRKHGDPLGGRTPNGDPLRFIHEVAMAHTGDECLTWPYAKKSGGYGTVYIDGKHVRANRYVCELANGAPPTPKHESAHSCGKGHEACIAPGHLSWKTHAENMADKFIHGTNKCRRRERHGLIQNPRRQELGMAHIGEN